MKRTPYSSTELIFLTVFLSISGVALAMESEDQSSPPQKAPHPVSILKNGGENPQKVAARLELHSLTPKIQKGDLEAMKRAKELRFKFKITDKDLGIESQQWPQKPNQVQDLPLEDRFAAIQKVRPDDRCQIPLKVRQEILDHELSKLPDAKERYQREPALKTQLALNVFNYTDSQEDALNDQLPDLTKQSSALGHELTLIDKRRDLLAVQKRILSNEEDFPQSVAKRVKQEIDEKIAKLDNLEKAFQNERSRISVRQMPLVRKVMRNYVNPESQTDHPGAK